MTPTKNDWEERFDSDPVIGGGFRDLRIMLRTREGIDSAIDEHQSAIKAFIAREKKLSEEETLKKVLEVVKSRKAEYHKGGSFWDQAETAIDKVLSDLAAKLTHLTNQ